MSRARTLATKRPDDPARIEPEVMIEPLIFDGENRRDQVLGHERELGPEPVSNHAGSRRGRRSATARRSGHRRPTASASYTRPSAPVRAATQAAPERRFGPIRSRPTAVVPTAYRMSS